MNDHATAESTALRRLIPSIVDDVVSEVHPARIILFGSVARGEAGPDRDPGPLVVLDDLDPAARARLMGSLRFAISAPAAIDVLVTDVDEYERRKDVNGSLLYWPAHEGVVVYERPAA